MAVLGRDRIVFVVVVFVVCVCVREESFDVVCQKSFPTRESVTKLRGRELNPGHPRDRRKY